MKRFVVLAVFAVMSGGCATNGGGVDPEPAAAVATSQRSQEPSSREAVRWVGSPLLAVSRVDVADARVSRSHAETPTQTTAGSGAAGDTGGAASLTIKRGQTLASALRSWLSGQQWVLRWEAQSDWEVPSDVVLPAGMGGTIDVVEQLAKWLHDDGVPLQFLAYEGNRVLVVRSVEPKTR